MRSRKVALFLTTTKFALAWASVDLLRRLHTQTDPARRFVGTFLEEALGGFPTLYRCAGALYGRTVAVLWGGGPRVVFLATVLAVLGALVRMVARARIRAGQNDFLDRARTWAAARAERLSVSYAVPGVLWAILRLWPGPWDRAHLTSWISDCFYSAPAFALLVWASFVLLKKGERGLLSPTLGEGAAREPSEIGPDEIAFDAVALTRRSIGLAAVFTAVMTAVPGFIWTRTINQLFDETWLFYLFVGYIAFAITGALAFRSASRIWVGVDGVHVRGTSPAHFLAYRGVDSARLNGANLELVRGGKLVLRLQLHGKDAARRDAILTRITENIARIREGRGVAAGQMVAAMSQDDLARAASGGAHYRVATLTRTQLWGLVEGPEIAAAARKTAAEALMHSTEVPECARLRIAAERCAEPDVRTALREMANAAEERSTRAAAQ